MGTRKKKIFRMLPLNILVSPALTLNMAALKHSGITSSNIDNGCLKAQWYHQL
jgi:hypothetical protein